MNRQNDRVWVKKRSLRYNFEHLRVTRKKVQRHLPLNFLAPNTKKPMPMRLSRTEWTKKNISKKNHFNRTHCTKQEKQNNGYKKISKGYFITKPVCTRSPSVGPFQLEYFIQAKACRRKTT